MNEEPAESRADCRDLVTSESYTVTISTVTTRNAPVQANFQPRNWAATRDHEISISGRDTARFNADIDILPQIGRYLDLDINLMKEPELQV